jgi:ADP-ribosylglycohydrolase
MQQRNFVKDGLLGLATGDALGVPVEFKDREFLHQRPVTEMKGYGSHNQPPGTWSDDTSLACCQAEALVEGIDLQKIADNFIRWRYEKWWTPHGAVFDIGMATNEAIYRLKTGTPPELAGGMEEDDNGNGSLMRIFPLAFRICQNEEKERYRITRQVSSITHGHVRSAIACHYFLEFVRFLMEGKEKLEAFGTLRKKFPDFLKSISIHPKEIAHFHRLFDSSFPLLPESAIHSGGYVIHTLEAAVWCLLETGSFTDAVLKAVNLGGDTDTTAAVAGTLAGVLYGADTIPEIWLRQLVKRKEIEALADRLHDCVSVK